MKKWLPFIITFLAGIAAAAAVYFRQGSEIERLTRESQPSAVGRGQAAPGVQTARKGTAAKTTANPERNKINAAMRPTRNGIRSLFERAGHIMEMDREEVEKLMKELGAAGRIRSPIAGISLMAAYARLAELDPAAAMARAVKERGEMREMAMFATMNEWLARDRNGAVAWFTASKDEDAKRRYLQAAAFTMGGTDPELITELSNSMRDPDQRRKALLDSIGALAFSDPDAALKKLGEIEDPDERAEAEQKVFQGFLFRYPEKALDFAMSKPPGDKARDNARQALVQWGEQDAGAALKWLTSQNSDTRKELFDSGQKGPGYGFGHATYEQINEAALKLSDQGQRDKLRAAWANSQGGEDPAVGLNQLSTIKDKDLQTSTAQSIGMMAARTNKTAEMTKWLESAQPNDARDTAVASFAAGIAQRDPAAGLEWANKITNSTIRNTTLTALKATAQPGGNAQLNAYGQPK